MNFNVPSLFSAAILIFSVKAIGDATQTNGPKSYAPQKDHSALTIGTGDVVRPKPNPRPGAPTTQTVPTQSASAESKKRQDPYNQAGTGFADPNCESVLFGFADIINNVEFDLWSDDINVACSVPAPFGNRSTWLIDADGPKWCLNYLFAQDYDYLDPYSSSGISTRPLVDPSAYISNTNDDPAIDTLTGSTPLSLYTASFLCMGAGDAPGLETQGRCIYYALMTEGLSVAAAFNVCFNDNNYVDRYASGGASKRVKPVLSKLYGMLWGD